MTRRRKDTVLPPGKNGVAPPSYLRGYEQLYARNPREAALAWFRDARYGLFLHYGLYSLLGRHEWVQLREKIPVAEYEKLAANFTAEQFNADRIADLAVAGGMRYVNITTRHHESFCLFRTRETAFNSLNTPCGRDLVSELAVACEKRGLGLCLYYSHGRDWRHPHAPNNDRWGGAARPDYDPPEPSYATGARHDLQQYLDFMTAQITELLTQYGPVASIWLDGIAVPLQGETAAFQCQKLYDHIHRLQPQVLVSYKQGVTGTEDYFAPEHGVPTETDAGLLQGHIGREAGKIIEVCTTLCPGSWGYMKAETGRHLTEEQVWEKLCQAERGHYNLLLNTGPLPDGSLDPEDEAVIRKVGRRLAEIRAKKGLCP
ncbi:MAG: alpha-L-fucosidase [Lentisphaerae bacterium]|nr:alpha-L-fucosidase [Lentisphaerota bacterium]